MYDPLRCGGKTPTKGRPRESLPPARCQRMPATECNCSSVLVLLDFDLVDDLRDTFHGMGDRMRFIRFGLAFRGPAQHHYAILVRIHLDMDCADIVRRRQLGFYFAGND